MNRESMQSVLLTAAGVLCLGQLYWFGTKCFLQISTDDIDYIGIARHIRNLQFHASINGFRSPLISWMIAASSLPGSDPLRIAKAFSVASYLLCVVLLYIFTRRLWQSRLAASLAVLLFSVARGLAAVAVEMAVPDFLFTALTLVYFILLLKCLRAGTSASWFCLGAVHALAFLCKAFAFPWLALSTVVALVLSPPTSPRLKRFALAAILPTLVIASWAGVLHSKYGVYTTGTQFRANFLQWTARAYNDRSHEIYGVLTDTKPFIDEYNVNDPMPPGSWPWRYRVPARFALTRLASAEIHNLPKALKELLILITPGGLLAFAYVVYVLFRRRVSAPTNFVFAAVALLGLLGILFAYCMLAFDGRYLYPVIPPILAVTAGFFLPEVGPTSKALRVAVNTLIVAGVLVSVLYPSSPFRKLDRDFQVSCYRAGGILRSHAGSTVVSIGTGPYPEHGVGWEAGYKAAYFGDRRLIAAIDRLPNASEMEPILRDVAAAAPDVVLVWGPPGDTRYDTLTRQLRNVGTERAYEVILDPAVGPVGTAVFIAHGSLAAP